MDYKIWKAAILVDDLETAEKFYADKLQMAVVQRNLNTVYLDAGGIQLELISKALFEGDERLGKTGLHHLSFRVKDIDKACEELNEKGIGIIKGPIDRGNGLRIAFFDGTDNVVLQLYELNASRE